MLRKLLRPRTYDVAIYCNNKAFLPIVSLLDQDNFCVINPYDRRLRLLPLLHMVCHGRLSRIGLIASQIIIKSPKVVITMMDNDVMFYQLKMYCPNTHFIAIQNGIRNNFSPSIDGGFFKVISRVAKSKIAIDEIFVFNNLSAEKYRDLELGATSITPIGSLLNNAVKPTKKVSSNVPRIISMISSLPATDPRVNERFGYIGDTEFSYNEYFAAEGEVAKFVHNFCQLHGYEMRIIGKRPAIAECEYNYFKDILPADGWIFVPRNGVESNYRLADESDVIVTIDSTFGYECLVRGARVAFLACRFDVMGIDNISDFEFGELTGENKAGPFWTNKFDFQEFRRVLEFCCNSSDDEWSAIGNPIFSQAMEYDPNNSTIIGRFQELGVKFKNAP